MSSVRRLASPLRRVKTKVHRKRHENRRTRAFTDYLAFLERSATLDTGELQALQQRLFSETLAAAEATPFQRQRLRAAGDVRTLEDLSRLAPVGKQALLEESRDSLVREGVAPRRVVSTSTSGSTAQPFTFWIDDLFHARSHAVRIHGYHQMGYTGGPILEVFDRPGATGTQSTTTPGFTIFSLHYGLSVPEQAEIARARQPVALYGNRTDILLLADELAKQPERLPPLKLVMTSSEALLDADREQLHTALRASVHNSYGLAEVSKVAWECVPGMGFHVVGPRAIVEVLRDGEPVGPGEVGEVVVTSLDNLVMPFLRYATGDLARPATEPCPCGRPGTVLAGIEGREYDSLRRTDGTMVSPASAYHPVFKPAWVMAKVRQWQIVQDRDDHVTVRIVPVDTPLDQGLSEHVVKSLQAGLGPLTVEVVEETEIPVEPNRKYRPVKRLV